ncbi:MAG: efflux RND transporter periplasmic adaptor subunit [Gemmatimonadaceae bacterium]|nr:efflux RND transporter periplasmic adaptor subunit [Gemmatimonadaceae bacterium]
MSKRAKWSIGIVLVAALALVMVLGAMKKGNKATEVRIEPVKMRDLVASVTASGQVSPRTKVDLSADLSGRIVRLAVKEGQMVSKGQFLLQIDPSNYEGDVQRAEAGLASARAQAAQSRANLEQARATHRRSSEIRKVNPTLISDEQLEQLRTAEDVNVALSESARHQVDVSAAALRTARSSLGKTTIIAPMSGRITRLNVEEGETAIMGTLNRDAATLLTISDMSVLETKIKVDETDVSRISVGDSAIIEIDAFGSDTTFVGEVVKISNSSLRASALGQAGGDQAIDYEVIVQLKNPPTDTRPDFSATARIITDMRKSVLSIPIIALTVRENESVPNKDSAQSVLGKQPVKQIGKKDVEGVFIVGSDNKVTFRPVRIGIAGDEYFEVLSGLRADERIVAGSYQAIRELKDSALVRETKVTDKKKPDSEAK